MKSSLAMSHDSVDATDLILRVSRDPENRLSGTVQTADGAAETRTFCGTLELMRVFEDLVPGATNVPKASGTLGH
jgi:hypothetical protein